MDGPNDPLQLNLTDLADIIDIRTRSAWLNLVVTLDFLDLKVIDGAVAINKMQCWCAAPLAAG